MENQNQPEESPGINPSGVVVGMVAATAAAILLAYIIVWSPNFEAAVPGDYLHFYLASRMVRDGEQGRLYDFPYQIQFQRDPSRMPFPPLADDYALYIYPPFFVWFCLPFSYLPFKTGAIAWVFFMFASLVAALRILLGTCGKICGRLGITMLAALPFVPVLISIYSCQNATLSLLILSTTYALLKKGKPATAGAVFALQAFKPQLTLVISVAMLCMKQWRFVAGALLGGSVLFAASLAVSPPRHVITSRWGRLYSGGWTSRVSRGQTWPAGVGSGGSCWAISGFSTPRRPPPSHRC